MTKDLGSRRGRSSKDRGRGPRAVHAYLDVSCSLVRLSGPVGSFRVILSFRDWAHGGSLSSHSDFEAEGQALDVVANAIAMFGLRRSPGRDQWRNAPSHGFRRAIWRVSGRLRRGRAGFRVLEDHMNEAATNQPPGVMSRLRRDGR